MYQGGIVVGIQAIMGIVAAGSTITAVAQSVAERRITPVAIITIDAAIDDDRPPAPKATASKKR